MAQIDTVRPTATLSAGGAPSDPWTASAGTLHGATSDNNDATYALSPAAVMPGAALRLQHTSHTPPADHQRHRARVRLRARAHTAAGIIEADFNRTNGIDSPFNQTWALTTSVVERAGAWRSEALFGLNTAGALSLESDFVWRIVQPSVQGQVRLTESYIDIDCREKPTFTPDLLDAAGVSRDAGTVTDTPSPSVQFGGPLYDSLPARNWTVEVRTDPGGVVVFTTSGAGTPPLLVEVGPLPDGDYVADLQIFSTIRINDAFASDVGTVSWTQAFVAPAAPVLSGAPVADPPGVDLDWLSDTPTATTWDSDDAVVTEIERTDCLGTHSIYVAQTGLGAATFFDRFLPLTEPEFFCIDQFGQVGGTLLRLAGTGFASTPDDASFAITGDIDIRVLADPDNWVPGATRVFAAHWTSDGTRAWSFQLRGDGALVFVWSADGSANTEVPSTVNLFGLQGIKWVRVTHDVNNGGGSRTTTFYTSDNGIEWTPMGAPVVGGAAGALFNSPSPLVIGNRNGAFAFVGDIYQFELYDGIEGTLVADPDFTEDPWAVGVTSGVDSFGNVWTLGGDAEIISACEACYRARYWGLVDGFLVPSDWSNVECEVVANPTPGNGWIKGVSSGDLSVCPDESHSRFRPFGTFQPISGGFPTVVTGEPSGRNYTLAFAVTSEVDLVSLEAILAQPLVFYQPVAQAALWLAPNVSTVQVTKVNRVRTLQVDTIAVNPQPQPDPSSFF